MISRKQITEQTDPEMVCYGIDNFQLRKLLSSASPFRWPNMAQLKSRRDSACITEVTTQPDTDAKDMS
jgi:hypothetical protein